MKRDGMIETKCEQIRIENIDSKKILNDFLNKYNLEDTSLFLGWASSESSFPYFRELSALGEILMISTGNRFIDH